MNTIVVVNNSDEKKFFSSQKGEYSTLTPEEYLKTHSLESKSKVYNLCQDYSYCKKGYYVSLLAEARDDRPYPSPELITQLENDFVLKTYSGLINNLTKKLFKDLRKKEFVLSIYFGKNTAERYAPLAKHIFSFFHAPLIQAHFKKLKESWIIDSVSPVSLNLIPKSHHDFLKEAMEDFFKSNKVLQKNKPKTYKYDLAILANDDEEHPPSNSSAIKKFIQAGKDLGLYTEVISKKDYASISKFDALFIRETTNVTDHTYKFSLTAQSEGLIVIDDPGSIIKCCNKVFLNDYLNKNKIPTPKTDIIFKETDLKLIDIQFPAVIKKPDSAFSAGVKKVHNREELEELAETYFQDSDLLIIQEYIRTDFDWRVGLIDGDPLYCCKYFMAKDHWQIIKEENKKTIDGDFTCFSLEKVPNEVLRIAQKACRGIGNSLYGVDIKEINGTYQVIEINDNPSIDSGVEDSVLGSLLYEKIMQSFLNRLEKK